MGEGDPGPNVAFKGPNGTTGGCCLVFLGVADQSDYCAD